MIVAKHHGSPRPRNTLTQLLPVTFPMELSAVWSSSAAVFDASVSGKLVPNATKVIAVMSSEKPMLHPSKLAKSPIHAVTVPIQANASAKHGHPPNKDAGGTDTNTTFQTKHRQCMIQSVRPASI